MIDVADRVVMFFFGFLWGCMIFKFFPQMWREMKADWKEIRQKENSADGTAELKN